MKIRKTKKGNSIRRIVAFLLCMTMVLGLGMQDVMEQVYAEGTPVTVQEGTAQDTEKITEGEQTGDEPAAPEETAPPTEETENEGSTGDTSGDGVQDEPDAGQPGEDTNTGESGGDNTGDTGTETQPGDGSTDTSGEEGNVDTPGEGEGQGTEEGDVTVPTVPEGEEGQKPGEGDAAVPEGEEGQKPGEGDAAASEDTEQADAPEEEEPAEGVAFEDSYTDEKVTIQVSAEAGVIPEGAVLSVTPIEKTEPDESMSDEEKAEAEKINAQYDLTEKKLTEESDENGEVMEGFLAYDISFLVTNEDGETQSEVEPAGEVKVVMDFNEAAVPEGVSENAEVSVKHLKEDETAEDGIVVEDVTENAVVTAAEASVPAVEKVELTAESFSTYVIKWEGRNPSLEVEVVDENGKPINGNEEYTGKYDFDGESPVDVETIANDIQRKAGISDEFLKAVYVEDGQEFDFNATRIYGLMYKDSQESKGFWKCINSNITGGDGWGPIDGTIYFVFGEEPEISIDPIETTVSTKEKNIRIDLFDYQVDDNGEEKVELFAKENEPADPRLEKGINKGHVLKFVSGKGSDHKTINIWQEGGSGKINKDMVQPTLSADGYPVLNSKHPGTDNPRAESLGYLFDLKDITASKVVYEDVDYLFQMDEYGNYEYDSADYYAYLKELEDGAAFELYSTGNLGFYPFTTLKEGYTAETLEKANDDPGAELGSRDVNHYFGMTISAKFYQPNNGQVLNTSDNSLQDMVFEFSGDDDVWVFIDDVLVLDLGGIHGAVGGKIDFSTGNVYTKDINVKDYSETPDTTLKDIFNAAGATGIEFSGNTFEDYTDHTIKFFYLERGNSASNCMIKFNLATIPEDSVMVSKEVVNKEGVEPDYVEDIDFQFQIEKKESSSGIVGILTNAAYEIYENGAKVDDGVTDPVTGIFTLKHGQTAVFNGFKENDTYVVRELGAYLDGYKVELGDTDVALNPIKGEGTTLPGQETGVITAGDMESVVFKNTVLDTVDLSITKKLAEGMAGTDEKFYFQVKIQNRDYKGAYQVKKLDGSTENKNTQVPSDGGKLGCIELQAGQTAVITGLPYGATFEVVEVLDENSPYAPAYEVSENGAVDASSIVENGKASGQIIGKGTDNKGAEVTVTNGINPDYKIDLTVRKEWRGPETEVEIYENITVQLYQNETPYGSPVTIEKNESGWDSTYYTFTGLPYYDSDGKLYRYSVKETQLNAIPVENKVNSGSLVINYATDPDGTLVIINSLPEQWYVQKISSTGKQPLGGAVFTLTEQGGDGSVYWGKSREEEDGKGWVVWWENKTDLELGDIANRVLYIPDGTYILEEEQAPNGYQKSTIEWEIEIEDLSVKSVTYTDAAGEKHSVNPVPPQTRAKVTVSIYQFENTAVFDLPETGGPGIHLYMLGGTLLLMAGSLLVYKKRKKEVLGS